MTLSSIPETFRDRMAVFPSIGSLLLLKITHIHILKINWFESSNNLTVRRIWHEIRRLTTLIMSCHASWVWKLFYFSTKTNTRYRSINLVLTEFYSAIKKSVSLCRHFWRELFTQMALKKSFTTVSCFNVNQIKMMRLLRRGLQRLSELEVITPEFCEKVRI